MQRYLLALLLLLGTKLAAAAPVAHISLTVDPATRRFTCRYRFALADGDTTTVVQFLLPRGLHLGSVRSSQGMPAVSRRYYPYLADTMQQVTARFAVARPHRQLTLLYTGTLDKGRTTAQALEFSAHSLWLPFRPAREYELLAYTLAVRVPSGWQVRGTRTPARAGKRLYQFRGLTSAIEPTAIIARQFHQFDTTHGAAISVVKAGASLTAPDTALLRQAAGIVHFYNRTIGRADSIRQFRLLLTGTQQDAFGLLDNATVLTYTDLNPANRADLLILAHEISHKWWSYGSVHDESDWLNEAFATYSSLLYLQARGDTAGYRVEYAKRAATTAGTPAIIGFDRFRHEGSMYRRVMYNKGTVVLAALHARVGTERLYAILAQTAAQKVSTTEGFLAVVEQLTSPVTRQWLLAELSR